MWTHIICESLYFLGGGLHVYNVAIIDTYQVISHPDFTHIWQYFITLWWQEKVGFCPIDETHPSSMTIICLLNSLEAPSESDHRDIKYHMTRTIIFSVASVGSSAVWVLDLSSHIKFKVNHNSPALSPFVLPLSSLCNHVIWRLPRESNLDLPIKFNT